MTTKQIANECKIERKVGQRVTCNGYQGTIARVCEWSDGMVEVRLASGLVCVDFAELLPHIRSDKALA